MRFDMRCIQENYLQISVSSRLSLDLQTGSKAPHPFAFLPGAVRMGKQTYASISQT